MGVIDPVGAGFVTSLAKPGGNATGFVAFEYTIGAKWLELLKEIAPHVTRAAVLRDPSIASGIGQFEAIQALRPFNILHVQPPLRAHYSQSRSYLRLLKPLSISNAKSPPSGASETAALSYLRIVRSRPIVVLSQGSPPKIVCLQCQRCVVMSPTAD
jgi:hypothetical protein